MTIHNLLLEIEDKIAKIKAFLAPNIAAIENEAEKDWAAFVDYLRVNVPPIAQSLAAAAVQTAIAALSPGAEPILFGSLVASLIAQAKTQGVEVLEDAAKAALTVALANAGGQSILNPPTVPADSKAAASVTAD